MGAIIELLAEQSVGGILRVKDRFHLQHIPFGYRDMLINVVCPGSKIVTEIQLHFEPLSKYKKISHAMYKRARLFERETENLAYKYSTKYLRPKIGSNKFYEPSKDDMIDDDDQENETKAVKSFDVLLQEWGLEKYIEKMRDEGWDDVRDWIDLTDDDLKNDIGFSKGHIRKWHRNFKQWAKKKEEEQKEAIAIVQDQLYGNNQLKMQMKSAQDAEDKERRRIMQQEQDKIDAMRKEMEREKKAMELERQKKEKEAKAKEEEARRKELEKRRKLKELEEEKEAEMERQKKKNNHEWDMNCKGKLIKVNGKIVNGGGQWGTIWIKGVVSSGCHEWRLKIISDSGSFCIGITNEKNEKKKDLSLETLYYWPFYGDLYDANGKSTITNAKAKKNDIVSMILDLKKNHIKFLLNGKQIGNAMTVKNGSYRAAVTLHYSSDFIELL